MCSHLSNSWTRSTGPLIITHGGRGSRGAKQTNPFKQPLLNTNLEHFDTNTLGAVGKEVNGVKLTERGHNNPYSHPLQRN